MSKKIIEFTPILTNNKTKKNVEKKAKPKPMITPNSLKSKFIEKIKEHKKKESLESLDKNNTPEDELSQSINYFSSLAKEKKQQQERQKTTPQMKIQTQPHTLKNYTSENASSPYQIPHVELELPEGLVEMKHPTPQASYAREPTQFDINYRVDNDVPYGCLKGGMKPTFKNWTQKNRDITPIQTSISYSVEVDPTKLERENKLNALKEKMKKKQEEEKNNFMLSKNLIQLQTPNSNLTNEKIVNNFNDDDFLIKAKENVTEGQSQIQNEILNDMAKQENLILLPEQRLTKAPNLIKKTIKRKITVGKSKKDSKVGVLIKDRETRKQVLGAQRELKKKPINDVKKYLREHGLMKVGSNAPNDVIRKMYESSVLTGDVMNNSKDILLHNFMKDQQE
jgi:hypothetical protein